MQSQIPALWVNPFQQGLVDDFRTFNWAQNIKYPELAYQKSQKYLHPWQWYNYPSETPISEKFNY